MPRALLISYSGTLGGAERALLDFSGVLGTETALACPDGPVAASARSLGLTVWPLAPGSLLMRGSAGTRIRAAVQLAEHAIDTRRLVRDLDPDVVVACGMRSALAVLLGPRTGVPVVFQHNDLLPGPMIARAVRRAAGRAALVIVPSRAVAQNLDPDQRFAERIEVVHPGVDVSRFPASSLPAEPPRALLLGALVEWKRPDVALDACALARKQVPELRLRVVGGTLEGHEQLEERLRTRARQADLAGAVDFVGAVADPVNELRNATCLLHCAPQEPFGMVVVEALAAGRPAIVPDAAGPADIVEESCGRRYPPADAAAAADALVEIAGNPALAERLGAAGRERARTTFALAAGRARWGAAVRRVAPSRARAKADPRDVAIVTVTHNSAPELEGLLSTAARYLDGVRVVVVDSGSDDDSPAVARAAPHATSIELGRNAGFGTGCNVGIDAVSEPVTVLLNPDVEILDDSLLEVAAVALADRQRPRLLAPLVLTPAGARQDSVHPLPGAPAELLQAVIPPRLMPRRLALGMAPWRARSPRRVGWAVGCAIVASTAALRGLGPFDPAIFLYGEDLDLGLRAAEAGIETWFWPHARVRHLGGTSAGRAFGGEPLERLARARREVIRRRLGPRRATLDDLAQAATFGSRVLLKPAAGRDAERERRQLAALLRSRSQPNGSHASSADA